VDSAVDTDVVFEQTLWPGCCPQRTEQRGFAHVEEIIQAKSARHATDSVRADNRPYRGISAFIW